MSKLIKAPIGKHSTVIYYKHGFLTLSSKEVSSEAAIRHMREFSLHINECKDVFMLKALHKAAPKNKTISRAYAKLLVYQK